MDITTTLTYLGEREDAGQGIDGKPWKHHAYNVLLTFEGRSYDFTYKQGMAYHREPEEAWRDRRGFALPDYLSKDGPRTPDPKTGAAMYPRSQRKRFHEERDAALIRGALESCASDLTLFDDYSDDELADEFDMKPSKIAEARGQIARLRRFLGRHVQEFITEYSEDQS